MTDIEERLRRHAEGIGDRNPNDYAALLSVAECIEAADEIERLRAAATAFLLEQTEENAGKLRAVLSGSHD